MANPHLTLDFHTNPSHPIFMHPNESPSLILVSPPLTGSNYHTWARGMTVAILSKNKIALIDGSIEPPATDHLIYNQWQRCNTMVMAWIHRSISDSIAKSILWIECARDAWIDLKDHFSQSDIFRVSDLREEIYKIHQGNRIVSEFFTQLKTMWDELENLKPLPICECDPSCNCGALLKMRDYRDRDHVIRFLKGLNDQYSSVRSQIMIIDPLPNVNRAFSMVVQQERQFSSESNNEVLTNVQNFVAFNNKAGANGGRRNLNQNPGRNSRGRGRNNGGRGNYGNRVSTHYGRLNHTVETCYQLHGYPLGYRSRNSDNHIANNASNTNLNENASTQFVPQNDITLIHPQLSHEQYQHIISLLQNPNPNTAITQSTHSVNIEHVFHTDTNSTGSVVLSPTLILQNVLYVPSFHISNKVTIGFAEQVTGLYVIVHEKTTAQRLFLAKRCDTSHLNKMPRICSPVTNKKSPFELIHQQQPNLTHLRVFGSLCYPTTLQNNRTKYSPRARKSAFIGYRDATKGFILYDLSSHAIFVSRHVIFYENEFPFHTTYQSDFHNHYILPFGRNPQPEFDIPLSSNIPLSDTTTHAPLCEPHTSIPTPDTSQLAALPVEQQLRRSSRVRTTPQYLVDYHHSLSVAQHNTSVPGLIKPISTFHPLSYVISYNNCSSPYKHFCLNSCTQFEPTCYSQAIKHDHWVKAMQVELSALSKNDTWSLVELPVGKQPIGCK
ncbi:uncharacterized protein LOC133292872 [Gastrolobium bilobum]|uniref:uncharacterized protein LOC133292872 n=1 Tax=Gastrolobium bilobum TaxID=150636 RepID=UPI002AB259F8|nr:uncharacterized protein LOC133292872 [Gastrolobium bilobum]